MLSPSALIFTVVCENTGEATLKSAPTVIRPLRLNILGGSARSPKFPRRKKTCGKGQLFHPLYKQVSPLRLNKTSNHMFKNLKVKQNIVVLESLG